MCVGDSGFWDSYHDWAMPCRIGRVLADLAGQIIRNQQLVENNKDEGDGPTKCLVHYDVILDILL